MGKRFIGQLATWLRTSSAPLVLAGCLCAGVADAQEPSPTPGASESVSATAPVAAPPTVVGPVSALPSTLEPRARALLIERERWASQRIGIIGPLSMLGAGLALTGIGWGSPLYTAGAYCSSDGYGRSCGWSPRMIAGAIIGTSGIALAAAGAAFLTVRVIRRVRRKRELDRIDGDLRILNLRANIAPWLGLTRGAPIGLSGKLSF